jgi:hypothetical protein
MVEPYRYNPHAPSHVNQQAREEAKKRGEDVTGEDAKQTQHEEGAPAAATNPAPFGARR